MSFLLNKIGSFFRLLPLKGGDRVLVALSGGMDSIVLADLCLKILDQDRVLLAYFNHRLRSIEEQKAERDLIESQVLSWRTKIFWGESQKDLVKEAKRRGDSLENLARHFRYDFLRGIQDKENIPYLATAHHADDQIETFLMRLTGRGSWASLEGIREIGEKGLIRPLLRVFREELKAYAEENKLNFWEDSTNQNLNYLRNSFRHKVIPALHSVAPHAKDSLLDWRGRFLDLRKWVMPFLPYWEKIGDKFTLPLNDWLSLPSFLRKELVLWGVEQLFEIGLISQFSRLTANFLDNLDRKKFRESKGILLKGHGIELRAHKLSLILRPLLVKKKEISYLLRVKSCEWYYLPWGRICLEGIKGEGFALSSFDHRWDFWRGRLKKGKKFFSQWRENSSEEICLILKNGEILALWQIKESRFLWREKSIREEFKILADKGENIGK